MTTETLRAPFPYFGGKRRAASLIWQALGNVDHYVEPFCGSAAVLLARPGGAGRCETINDADGMVSNFWRAVRSAPDAVAAHCDWPVAEPDLHARHLWLIGRRESLTARLIDDPEWFDAKAAGWWCWGACAWIGSGWCGSKTPSHQLPHLSNPGQGVHAPRKVVAFADEAVGHGSVGEWLRALQGRLRGVRVAAGDWQRVVASPSVLFPTDPARVGRSTCGVLIDPPYSEGRVDYAAGGTGSSVSADARAWAIEHGGDPRLRIVLCGYEGEHDMPAGWRVAAWKTKGGYASASGDNANQKRERLWLSPHCVEQPTRQPTLFDLGGSK